MVRPRNLFGLFGSLLGLPWWFLNKMNFCAQESQLHSSLKFIVDTDMRISKNREWPPTASLPREIRFSLGFCEPQSVGLCNHCDIDHIFGNSSIPMILIWLPGYGYLPILGNGLLLGTPQNGTVYSLWEWETPVPQGWKLEFEPFPIEFAWNYRKH